MSRYKVTMLMKDSPLGITFHLGRKWFPIHCDFPVLGDRMPQMVIADPRHSESQKDLAVPGT